MLLTTKVSGLACYWAGDLASTEDNPSSDVWTGDLSPDPHILHTFLRTCKPILKIVHKLIAYGSTYAFYVPVYVLLVVQTLFNKPSLCTLTFNIATFMQLKSFRKKNWACHEISNRFQILKYEYITVWDIFSRKMYNKKIII